MSTRTLVQIEMRFQKGTPINKELGILQARLEKARLDLPLMWPQGVRSPPSSSFLYGIHSKFLWTRFYNKARTKRKQKKKNIFPNPQLLARCRSSPLWHKSVFSYTKEMKELLPTPKIFTQKKLNQNTVY